MPCLMCAVSLTSLHRSFTANMRPRVRRERRFLRRSSGQLSFSRRYAFCISSYTVYSVNVFVWKVETGTPYMLYKDACNKKSNQQNLGTIRSSNLCTEIIEYTSPDEVAVCNLASINLSAFVSEPSSGSDGISFDFQKLYEITKVVARNLNKVIDRGFYPVAEAKKSNLRHRPIGIGVQGLADAFCKMRFAFESEEAMKLNRDIFETIYFGAVEASIELAEAHGRYESFDGSPASRGQLQFDLWDSRPPADSRWNWAALKERLVMSG